MSSPINDMPKLEIACFNLGSVEIACEAGADRIELCVNAELGGTTPDLDLCRQAYQCASSHGVPMRIMIRPRGGSFAYTDSELAEMCHDLAQRREYADGFVFGVLTSSNKVNVVHTKLLVDLADPLPCTFHRAVDLVEDLYDAAKHIRATGCSAILTAGGPGGAAANCMSLLKLRQTCCAVEDFTMIVGGGVRTSNLSRIHELVRAEWYHSSALLTKPHADLHEIRGMQAILTQIPEATYQDG